MKIKRSFRSKCIAVGGLVVVGAVIAGLQFFNYQSETNAMNPGEGQTFNYTGSSQSFTATTAGWYTIEAWGANGGDGPSTGQSGGRGGYTQGSIYLNAGETIYIYVGGAGTTASAGGWNGGGTNNGNTSSNGRGGGGATDIRLANTTDLAGLMSRIMVAGGGGGANSYTTTAVGGGYGGGLIGGSGAIVGVAGATLPQGGTQIAGGARGGSASGWGTDGTFGVGGNSSTLYGSSGGGGYFGGGGGGYNSNSVNTGAGGSSFISGYVGANAVDGSSTNPSSMIMTGQPNHFSGKVFTGSCGEPMQMLAGNDVNKPPNPIGGNNGYVRISMPINKTAQLCVNSVAPNMGDPTGGDVVNITGWGFQNFTNSDFTVEFDGVPATNVAIVDNNTLSVTTPAHNAGGVMVTLTAAGLAYNFVISNSFIYIPNNINDLGTANCAKDFQYTGDYQTYTAIASGFYQIEAWGASGGNGTQSGIYGGAGGYTKGIVWMDAGDTFYLYVGGTAVNGNHVQSAGGWNGGGTANTSLYTTTDNPQNGRGGGGASDIRLVANSSWSNFDSLKSRVMVAAGGGGASAYQMSYQVAGGNGGGLTGGSGFSTPFITGGSTTPPTPPTGGTQTAGGSGATGPISGASQPGTFGTGGNANISWGSAGGGGYYGGGGGSWTASRVASGAGGSSFISGHPGSNAVSAGSIAGAITHTGQPNHYSGVVFVHTEMIAGNAVMPNPNGGTMTGNAGNGRIHISTLSALEVCGFTPDTGPDNGGTVVTFDGAGFNGYTEADIAVTFDGSPVSDVEIVDDRTFTAKTPWHIAGPVDVQVDINTDLMRLFPKSYTYFIPPGSVVNPPDQTFTCDRTINSYTPPNSSIYLFEAWGASGGNNTTFSGRGAYTRGYLNLTTSDTLYLVVGCYDGWNGGGTATEAGSGAGGGASDIRLTSGAWNDFTSQKSRIMVAAGGGGNEIYVSGSAGGYGGALTGGAGARAGSVNPTLAGGATQTAGGVAGGSTSGWGVAGVFGQGGNANTSYGSGGGGGYFGGGGGGWVSSGVSSGGGGSSFVSGFPGVNAIDSASASASAMIMTGQPNHYSGTVFTQSNMIAGNATMPDKSGSGTTTGNLGHGQINVTTVADPIFVSSFSPTSGPKNGGTQITITGENLIYGSLPVSVTLDEPGTSAACNIISSSGTQIVCTTTAHVPGMVRITVNNGARLVTTYSEFEYENASPVYEYIITANGSGFNAVGLYDDATTYPVGTAGDTIQNIINAIRGDTVGNDCRITFQGSGGNALSLGSAGATFIDSTETWGKVTIDGMVTSGVWGATISTNGVEIEVTDGQITNTHGNGIALANQGTGKVTISGGALYDTGNGSTIRNYSTGQIIIDGGTVSSNQGHAIWSDGGGKITIAETVSGTTLVDSDGAWAVIRLEGGSSLEMTGGSVLGTGSSAGIYNASSGSITISGGTIENTNDGSAITTTSASTGKITISGTDTLLSSAFAAGTITLNGGTAGSTILEITGGTIENVGSGDAIRNNSIGTIKLGGDPTIDGTTMVSAGTLSVITSGADAFAPVAKTYDLQISNPSDGAVAVVDGTTFISNFSLVNTGSYALFDDGTDLILGIPYITLEWDNSEDQLDIGGSVSSSGTVLSGSTTIDVITNARNGFNLQLSMNTSEQRLTCTNNSGTNFYLGAATSTSLGLNEWGFSLNSGSTWLAVPVSGSATTVKSTSVPNELGESTIVSFGGRLNSASPACRYGGVVKWTASVK